MRPHQLSSCLLALLLVPGCESRRPPAGVVYEGKHASEWADIVCESKDRDARIAACKVIIRMGKEGVDAKHAVKGSDKGLWGTINDEDPIIRGWAAVAMIYATRGTPYPTAQVLFPKAREATESDDEELRTEAKLILDAAPSRPAGPSGPPGGGRGAPGDTPADENRAPTGDSKPPTEKKASSDEGKPLTENKPPPGESKPRTDNKGTETKPPADADKKERPAKDR